MALPDSHRVKSWVRSVSKVANDQVQWAKETIVGKPPQVPDDSLRFQRQELEEHEATCRAIQGDLQQFFRMVELSNGKAERAAEVHRMMRSQSNASLADLQAAVEQYAEATHQVLGFANSTTRATVEQLLFEVNNRLTLLVAAERKFETRDRLYRKVQDRKKKLERAHETRDPRIAEKRRKLDNSEAEFSMSTQDVSDEVTHLLSGRSSFLRDIIHSSLEAQAEYFRHASSSFAVVCTSTRASDSRRMVEANKRLMSYPVPLVTNIASESINPPTTRLAGSEVDGGRDSFRPETKQARKEEESDLESLESDEELHNEMTRINHRIPGDIASSSSSTTAVASSRFIDSSTHDLLFT